MEDKGILVTQEGYEKLEKELDYLKTEKRAEIAEKIKVALGFGDLSENSPGTVRIVSLKADGSDDERTSLMATTMAG